MSDWRDHLAASGGLPTPLGRTPPGMLALLFASTRGSYETTRGAIDKLAANVS